MMKIKVIMAEADFQPIIKFGNHYFAQWGAEPHGDGEIICNRIDLGTDDPTDESIAEAIAKCKREEKDARIVSLKKRLAGYDYIGVKIATGVATIEDYKEEIAEAENIRKEIRSLEE